MNKMSYQIHLSSDGTHKVIVTFEVPEDARDAIARARVIAAQLTAKDSVQPATALLQEHETPPECPIHQRTLDWVAKGRGGPFWSCHERDDEGTWCTYTQQPSPAELTAREVMEATDL